MLRREVRMEQNFARNTERPVQGRNRMVLGDGNYFSLDCYETQLNNNVLVVGGSGCGKTRSVVAPNLLQAAGSYIISDPKGVLYRQYGKILERRGYKVRKLDFVHPEESCGYNFFRYIRTEQDILKTAHMLVYGEDRSNVRADPYWEQSAEVAVSAVISLLMEQDRDEQNLGRLLDVTSKLYMAESNEDGKHRLDRLFLTAGGFTKRQYRKFRVAPARTRNCTLATVLNKVGPFDTNELRKMMSRDETHIGSIGNEKTALFVIVSDTDRSMDRIANLFFTQAMNELCRIADLREGSYRLPVDVRFILDDFATNVVVQDFPRMISSIRSRGISVMLMIQAESQLMNAYGKDGSTIIANCDSYLYMGGNDVETAEQVARRCGLPLEKILYMPVGSSWLFRRGQSPVPCRNICLEEYERSLIRRKTRSARHGKGRV